MEATIVYWKPRNELNGLANCKLCGSPPVRYWAKDEFGDFLDAVFCSNAPTCAHSFHKDAGGWPIMDSHDWNMKNHHISFLEKVRSKLGYRVKGI